MDPLEKRLRQVSSQAFRYEGGASLTVNMIEKYEGPGAEVAPVLDIEEVGTDRFKMAQFQTAREGVNERGAEDGIRVQTAGLKARRLDKRDGPDTRRHCC